MKLLKYCLICLIYLFIVGCFSPVKVEVEQVEENEDTEVKYKLGDVDVEECESISANLLLTEPDRVYWCNDAK